MPSAKPTQSVSQSRYWNSHFTAALWALEDGIDRVSLTEKLAKLYGQEDARRIVDTASVRLWLAEGMRPGDAITMQESRRRLEMSALECRAYTIEILLHVRQAMGSEDGPLASSRHESRCLERAIAPSFQREYPCRSVGIPCAFDPLSGKD